MYQIRPEGEKRETLLQPLISETKKWKPQYARISSHKNIFGWCYKIDTIQKIVY